MCDRRVLEALGHDSLVDLAIRQQEVIQELDAAVAGLKAEKEARAWAIPRRIVTGMAVTPDAVDQVRAYVGAPTGADTGQEAAPPDDQTRGTEPVGHDNDGTTTGEGGAGRSDVPHVSDSRQVSLYVLGADPDHWPPPVVLDQGGKAWILQDTQRDGEPVYVYEPVVGHPTANGLKLSELATMWGPLKAARQ